LVPNLPHPPRRSFSATVLTNRRCSSAASRNPTEARSMHPDPAVLPPRYLRTKEAAAFLSLSARTLEKHRTYGTGPAYHKLGGRVVYSVDDLKAWADRGAVTS